MIRCVTENDEVLIASQCEENPTRVLSRSNQLFCPNCKQLVRYNKGKKKVYFSHQPNADCVVTDYESETEQHLKGKDILYNWLQKKFPDALVVPEVYIKETNQIADILITHTTGPIKGRRWAIEFQHSNLSSDAWKARHELYKGAGILDFWIFDQDVFLRHSESKDEYLKKSRKKKDPTEMVFYETGFCYFLNLDTSLFTADYKFKYEDHGYKNYPPVEYRFHDPYEHSVPLNDIKIRYNKKYHYGAMFGEKFGDNFKSRFDYVISRFKREEQMKWQKEHDERAEQIKEYAKILYGDGIAEHLFSFMEANEGEIKHDVHDLTNEEFTQKYDQYVKQLQKYAVERDSWKESENLEFKIYDELSWKMWNLREKMEFLNDKYDSLEQYMNRAYLDEIKMISYVYKEYESILDRLVNYRPIKSLEKRMHDIKSGIMPYSSGDPLTKFDFAAIYYKYKTNEEVDEIFSKIESMLDEPDPFLIDMSKLF
jgi:competence protein CoiA